MAKGLRIEGSGGNEKKKKEDEMEVADPEWEHVEEEAAEASHEPHSDSPQAPGYSPAEPHPPDDPPVIRYVFTMKSGERIHRRERMTLRRRSAGSLVSAPRCTRCFRRVCEDGRRDCLLDMDLNRSFKPCKHCISREKTCTHKSTAHNH